MKLEYQFTPNQEKKILAWQSTLPMFTGSIMGRFVYTIQPTGVGTIVKVKDIVSKEEIDVSEIP
jgi:hypothetical protein